MCSAYLRLAECGILCCSQLVMYELIFLVLPLCRHSCRLECATAGTCCLLNASHHFPARPYQVTAPAHPQLLSCGVRSSPTFSLSLALSIYAVFVFVQVICCIWHLLCRFVAGNCVMRHYVVNGASEGKQHTNWPAADEVVFSCLHFSFFFNY